MTFLTRLRENNAVELILCHSVAWRQLRLGEFLSFGNWRTSTGNVCCGTKFMLRARQSVCQWQAMRSWLLGMAIGISAFSSHIAVAQITPDGTLGTESSVVTPNVEINNINSARIDGGATRGSNLFHSFEQFNIGENGGAYFSNPTGIENIITRVTGSSGSNINGTLGVLGSANLFFINPSGIIFGGNARLDVRGSFIGSTASAIQFGEQGFFSASNPYRPSVLTINPSALFFNQSATAEIVNSSVAEAGFNPVGEAVRGLRVPDGRSLLLVGGDINLNGGSLRAYGGRIDLAAIKAPGVVALNAAGNSFSLDTLLTGCLRMANCSVLLSA
jgi:filamentous hemagglutinin family protein